MKRILPLLLLIAACSSGNEKEQVAEKPSTKGDASEELLGEWRNLSMIVRMSDSTVNVPAGRWKDVLGIKPIRTTFSDNGSFISEYRTLEDSVFMTSTGVWSVSGDTLSMVERGTENKYFYSIDGDTVLFRGYLDWDQDGNANDHYAGKQIRAKKID